MCRQMVQKIQGFYLFYETDEYLCQGCFGSNLEEVGAKIENRQETKYMRMIQIQPTTTPEMLKDIEIGALRLARSMSSAEQINLTTSGASTFLCRFCLKQFSHSSKNIQYICLVCPLLFCSGCYNKKYKNSIGRQKIKSVERISHQYINQQRFGHLSSHPCAVYIGHFLGDYVMLNYY